MTDTTFLTLDLLPENGRVLIYGSGAAALAVLERIRAERPDIDVPCLIDSFNEGEAGGLPVRKKEALADMVSEYDLILIASAWWRDIGQGLEEDGIEAWGVAATSLWHKYVYSEDDMARAKGELDSVEAMLADDRDREIYRFLLDARRDGSPLVNTDDITPRIVDYVMVKNTLFSHLTEQYLDFVRPSPVKTILHAGVFDGGDCLNFLRFFPNLEAVHGFEPRGKENIAPSTQSALEQSGKIHIHPKGLWSGSEAIPCTGTGCFTTLAPNAKPEKVTGIIETVGIDEFVARNRPESVDYICLDVEGAEKQALKGAQTAITQFRPQLAVCIYHKKEDIFRLPLLLDEMLDDYVFHIGHYYHYLNETVLYAIPRELEDVR